MKAVKCITKILVIVGALNWGLVGFFQYDLVSEIFGGMATTGARVVFGLVGLAGLYKLFGLFCGGSCGSSGCGCGCSGCSSGSGCCNRKHQQ